MLCIISCQEMQMRSHVTLIRIAIIKKADNSKCSWGCTKNCNLLLLLMASKMVQLFWKTLWQLFQVPNIEIPHDPALLFLGLHLRQIKTCKRSFKKRFVEALFIMAQKWKEPKCALADKWISKTWDRHP